MNADALQFDPYYKWLGISPKDQPPDHYRLLGIDPFESDVDVIESAADRQMAHLRNYQAGENASLSQRLLNEVAAVRVALLNADRKAAYDAAMRARLSPAQPIPSAPLANPPPRYFPVAQAVAAPLTVSPSMPRGGDSAQFDSAILDHQSTAPTRRRKSSNAFGRILAHVVASVVGLGVGYLILCWINDRRELSAGVSADVRPPALVSEPRSPAPVIPASSKARARKSDAPSSDPPSSDPPSSDPPSSDPVQREQEIPPAEQEPPSNPAPRMEPRPIKETDFLALADIEIGHQVIPTRLLPGQVITTDWAQNPKWTQIPDQFQNWYFGKASAYQATTAFQVNRSGTVVIGISGDWGGGGSGGAWQQEIVSREAIEEQGWHEVGQLLTDQSEFPHFLFARGCQAGESFKIRTHKYSAPMVVAPAVSRPPNDDPHEASIPMAIGDMAALTIEHEVRWNRLMVGKRIPSTSQALEWAEVPKSMRGRPIASGNGSDGVARFKVESAGTVVMAVMDYSKRESQVIQDLEAEGWQPVCRMSSRWLPDKDAHDGNWLVLARKCDAGETFTVSTDKYNAPILISPSKP